MSEAYRRIIESNLTNAFASNDFAALSSKLGGTADAGFIAIKAFAKIYRLHPDGLIMEGRPACDPRGVVVSLYALNAKSDPIIMEPLKAFEEFPGSMPYRGAFRANAEQPLVPYVGLLGKKAPILAERYGAHYILGGEAGDFSLTLFPLPKICLKYVCYLPDEEFSASIKCLFSNNAETFLPLDGLADLAEYTTRDVVSLMKEV